MNLFIDNRVMAISYNEIVYRLDYIVYANIFEIINVSFRPTAVEVLCLGNGHFIGLFSCFCEVT
jgi:hypothetical protein